MHDPKEAMSHAILIAEYTELLQAARLLIAVCKQVAHSMPARERAQMLDAAIKAEEATHVF